MIHALFAIAITVAIGGALLLIIDRLILLATRQEPDRYIATKPRNLEREA
jgi:hypothetical protein